MLTLIFVALMQAAAGDPAPAPQDASPAPPTEQTQPATPPSAAATEEQTDRNRRRCRVQNVTGSRLGARVCMSQAEEERAERDAQELLNDVMRMGDNGS